ncbi:MAG: hypothetical protein SPG64_03495 [Candidatus Enteromonas sp.]|nr:hypothetical protein [Candidatus Enteromonas sp.]
MPNSELETIRFEDVEADVQQKNADIAEISLQADEAMAPSLEAYRTHSENVLSVAAASVVESTNALALCTRKAFEKKDEALTNRLLHLYRVFEGGEAENE